MASVRISSPAIPASKIRPPRVRHAEITRTHLLADVDAADREILAICAPAGFGKSTFAIQWASRSDLPVSWFSLDDEDDDPVVLIAGLAAALRLNAPAWVSPDSATYGRQLRPEFLASVAALPGPVTLVVDDVQQLRSTRAINVLRAVVDALPVGSRVALVGRDLQALPVALWRGQGRVADVRAEQLVFRPDETMEAVHNAENAEEIREISGGWPVMVFLLSQVDSGPAIHDYVGREVLDALPAPLREFVLDTAPLGTVNSALAAHVHANPDASVPYFLSEAITTELLRADESDWYIYHPLLVECCTSYLEREDPHRLSALRARGARWHLDHSDFDVAVSLAAATGDDTVFADVVWNALADALLLGRTSSVDSWLHLVDPSVVARQPALTLAAAWADVARGSFGAALRHGMQSLQLMPDDWPSRPDDFPFAGYLALLQAVTGMGLDSPQAALERAVLAEAAIDRSDPAICLAIFTRGLHGCLLGNAGGQKDLVAAFALSEAFDSPATAVAAQFVLGLHLLSTGQPTAGCDALATGRALYMRHDLSQMLPVAALVALGDVALESVRGGRARVLLAIAEQRRMWDRVEHVLPWYDPLSHAVLANVMCRLGDANACREHLAGCDGSTYPVEGLVGQWAAAARLHHDASSPLAALTAAESRVWDLLSSRMTLGEIGEALFLSRETVKSHATSIYRKLGVTTRREAQDLADRWS